MLALKRMLFVLIRLDVRASPAVTSMLLDVLLELFHALTIHLTEDLQCQFDVTDQAVTTLLAEVLTDDHTHHLQVIAVWSHGVGWDDPTTFTKLVSNSELVVEVFIVGVKAEGNHWQGSATSGRHDLEAQCSQLSSEVVGCAGKIEHDTTIATFAETDHLVVLANDLAGAFAEVESE